MKKISIRDLEQAVIENKMYFFIDKDDTVFQKYISLPERSDSSEVLEEKISEIKRIIKGLKLVEKVSNELDRCDIDINNIISIEHHITDKEMRYFDIRKEFVKIYTDDEIAEDYTIKDIIDFLELEVKLSKEIVEDRENTFVKSKKVKEAYERKNK